MMSDLLIVCNSIGLKSLSISDMKNQIIETFEVSWLSVECFQFIPSARCLLFFWFIANRQRRQLLKSWAVPCPQCAASRQLVDMNQAIRVAPCPVLHRSMIILLCAGLVLTTSANVHDASIFNRQLETGWRLGNGSVGRDHQTAQAGQSFCSAYSISKPDVTFAQQTSASQNAFGSFAPKVVQVRLSLCWAGEGCSTQIHGEAWQTGRSCVRRSDTLRPSQGFPGQVPQKHEVTGDSIWQIKWSGKY